jgi:hypothetical protein
LVAGGIIYRLVTPNRPGEPSLDDPSADLQFRREYWCGGKPPWTKELEEAKFFPTHLAADDFAKTLGGHEAGVIARAIAPMDQEAIPEQLQPVVPEPPPQPLSPPRATHSGKKRKRRHDPRKDRLTALRASHSRVVEREDWVTNTYG